MSWKALYQNNVHNAVLELVSAAPYLAGVLGVPEHPRNLRVHKKGQSLISAYQSLAITANTPGFEKLNKAL